VVITLGDYAEIRRLFNSGTSKRAIAKKLGISRNTVDKYCQGDTTPWNKKAYSRQSTIISDEVMNFIRQCLEEDELEGVRKQKHTAKRIFDRLVEKVLFGEPSISLRNRHKSLLSHWSFHLVMPFKLIGVLQKYI
jgi:predicted transcriptional regulator